MGVSIVKNKWQSMTTFSVKNDFKSIIGILCTGFITHFAMIFVRGAWWDDWKFYVCSYSSMRDHYFTAGRIIAYYMLGLIFSLPLWVLHILTIIIYAIVAVVFYYILIEIIHDKDAAFIMALLFNMIPVNDGRILKCVFPYTLSLLLFSLASLVLLRMEKISNLTPKKVIMRILSLLMFFISFSTNSFLVFYCIPIGIILLKKTIFLQKQHSLTVPKLFSEFIKLSDFYVLPFVYFAGKKIFAVPVGLYADYNTVNSSNSLNAVIKLPWAVIYDIGMVIRNYLNVLRDHPWSAVPALIAAICVLAAKKNVSSGSPETSLRSSVLGMLAGIITVAAGIFPYVVIRHAAIETTGFGGRDAILMSFGISVIIYYAMEAIRLPIKYKYAIVSCLFVFSFIHFGNWYIRYQKGFYEQQALIIQWEESGDVAGSGTYLYINQSLDDIKGRDTHALQAYSRQSFWTLGAMAKYAYNNTSRVLLGGTDEISYIVNPNELAPYIKDPTYCVDRYTNNDNTINGVIFVDYSLTDYNCIKLRFEELTNNPRFRENLMDIMNYSYIGIEPSVSLKILDLYRDGNLNDKTLENSLSDEIRLN